jgi:UDP-N-acetylmuramyl pentapeptide phosphotransferase/UDP-N-acetylglucosamine-1-phosphate transferase
MLPVLLILTLIVSYSGTYIVIRVATKKDIMDIPNIRSSHIQPTPRGGGIAIAVAWFASLTVLMLIKGIPNYLFFSLLCGIPIAVIGLMDDIITIPPKFRLLVQILFSSLAVFFLHGCNFLDLGFTNLYSPLVFNIIAIVGIVWFINLFNFLDGIDGYISAEIIFICLGAFMLTSVQLPLYMAAATAGFIIWNWQPAKIFMGDVGSTLLGFTIGIFSLYYQNINQSSILIWLMLTSLFWFDATMTLLRRIRNHEQLSIAHKKHAYQRIVQSGFSHQKTVLYSIFINIPILGLTLLAYSYPVLIVLFFTLNLCYLFLVMTIVDKRFPFRRN